MRAVFYENTNGPGATAALKMHVMKPQPNLAHIKVITSKKLPGMNQSHKHIKRIDC